MSRSNGEFNCILWLKLIGDFMKNGILYFLNRLSDQDDKIVLFTKEQVEPTRDLVNIKDIRYRLGAWEGESVNDDPQIYLYNKAEEPLDSQKYRFIKFSLFSSHSAKGQFVWRLSDDSWQASRHFSISQGWEDYCFDMRTIPTYGTFAGSGVGWESLVKSLRLDPCEQAGVFIKIKKVKLAAVFPGRLNGWNNEIPLLIKKTVDAATDLVNIKDIRYRFNGWEGVSVNDDPQIYLYGRNKVGQPLDSQKYRFIKFFLFSSHFTRGQFVWWLSDGRWQSSRHFLVLKGWNNYCFDMRTIPTYGTFAGSGVGWEGLVGKLRLDPAEKAGVFFKVRSLKLISMLKEKISCIFIPVREGTINIKQNNDDCSVLSAVVKSKPVLIHAEISTKCNLRCRMCGLAHYDIPKSEQGFMSKIVFEKLSSLFTPGTQLALFGRGESLLHPEFIYFLEAAIKAGMRISFNTNGSILTKRIANALVRNKQERITFSCSAGCAKTYREIHCGNTWDRLWNSINMLNKEKKKIARNTKDIVYLSPLIYIEFISQISNIAELPLLLKKAFKYNVRGLIINNLIAHSKDMEKETLDSPGRILLANRFYEQTTALREELIKHKTPNFDLRFPCSLSGVTKKFICESEENNALKEICLQLDKTDKDFTEDHFCLEPWRTFYVRFDGTAAPCCVTGRSLGNLNESTAEEIWNGEMYQKFRQRMNGKDKPYECLRCHLFPGAKKYDKGLDNIDKYEPL